jgi:hypothetical protein
MAVSAKTMTRRRAATVFMSHPDPGYSARELARMISVALARSQWRRILV